MKNTNYLQNLSDEDLIALRNRILSLNETPNRNVTPIKTEVEEPVSKLAFDVAHKFAQNAVDDFSFGFANKLEAGLESLFDDKTYNEHLKRIIKRNEQNRYAAPVKKLAQRLGGDRVANVIDNIPFTTSDVGQVAGALATPFKHLSFAKGFKPVLKQSKTGVDALKTGAQMGALSAVGHNTSPDIETDIGSALAGAMSGAKGAAIGYGLGHGIKGGANLIKGSINKLAGKQNVTPEKDIASLLEPEAAERYNLGKKFGVDLTLGEILQDREKLLLENAAEKGTAGMFLQKAAKDALAKKNKNFETALDTLQKNVSGVKSGFQGKGEHARKVVDSLKTKAGAEKKLYDIEYDKYNQMAPAFIEPAAVKKFANEMQKYLQESNVGIHSTPQPYNLVKDFKQQLNVVTKNLNEDAIDENKLTGIALNNLNDWYKTTGTALSDAKTAAEKRGINKLREFYDNNINDLLQNNIVKGSSETLNQYNMARSKAKDWFEKYGDGQSDEVGQKFINKMVKESKEPLTNEQIVREFFGGSNVTFDPKTVNRINKLKKLIEPEKMNEIKLEALERLLAPLKPGDNINKAATTFVKNFNKFKKENPTLVKTLFTPQDIKEINDIGELSRIIYTRPIDKMNPSGTADSSRILQMLKDIPKTPGLKQSVDAYKYLANQFKKDGITYDPKEIEKQIKNIANPPKLNNLQKGIIRLLSTNTNKRDLEIDEAEEQSYAKGGQVKEVGSHYNVIKNAIVSLGQHQINDSDKKEIKKWLTHFGDIHDLKNNKQYQTTLGYVDKIKNKGQVILFLSYMSKVPQISKKKMFDIRKAFVEAKN